MYDNSFCAWPDSVLASVMHIRRLEWSEEISFTLRNAALVAVAASGLLFGRATSQKIQVVQPGDQNLSCNAIKEELAKPDKAQAEIDSKKGVTGTNVAAALLWLPDLAYTYYDAGEATRLISDRKSALTAVFNNKNRTA
ncbi:MAG: hypothetical protein M3Q16_09240 [Pseudomonadota bacterium]|nr:hypothetical protein [Pseudomonadota bacterium]